MTVPLVLVTVFAAFSLGLSSFALWLAVSARNDARDALDAVRAVAARLPRKRPAPEAPAPRVERREQDLGPPEGQPERRRHRAPDDAPRARRRDEDDPQWKVAEPGTSAIPVAVDNLAAAERRTEERFRRPPPPLPRPGAIGRPQ